MARNITRPKTQPALLKVLVALYNAKTGTAKDLATTSIYLGRLEREGLVMEVFGRTRRTEGLGQAARPGRYLVNAGIDDAPADVRAYSGGLLQAIIHGRLKGNAVRRRIDDRRPEHDDVIFRHNNFPLRKGAFVSLLPAGRG